MPEQGASKWMVTLVLREWPKVGADFSQRLSDGCLWDRLGTDAGNPL